MKKKKITFEEIISFLETEKARADSVRTSKLPEVLSSKGVLIKAKELIKDLIDRWSGYESHVITIKMVYIDGELEKDIIEEYWDVLKDINIEEEKREEKARKEAIKNCPSRSNLLETLRAQDRKPHGHI